MRTGSSTCAHWKSLPVLALSVIGLTGCSPLALESGTAITVTEPPPATVGIVPTLIPTDSGGYPGPEPSVPPPTIVPTVEETPPYLIATPKPITHSITSTADWIPYESSKLGLSLKYPELPPSVFDEKSGTREWTRVLVNIRTGPTLPGVWTNNAVIEISIYPNRDALSLREFVTHISDQYGGLYPVEGASGPSPILDNLTRAGAEDVAMFTLAGGAPTFYGAKHGGFVYLFVAGTVTASPTQDQVFELLTSTLQFRNPR